MTTADPTVQPEALMQPDSEFDIIKKINEAIEKNTTAADIRFSRLAMLQPQSPEITKKFPGYEDGMIIDNVTREILSVKGKPPWLLDRGVKEDTLTPLHYCQVALNFKLPTEYIEWIPKMEQVPGGDRWKFKTLDPKDPRVIAGTWISQGGKFTGKKPPVTINTNYLLSVIDPELRMMNGNFRVATFCRTSATCGQTVASILYGHKMQNIRPWDRTYYLYTQRHDVPQPHYVFMIARGPMLKDVVDDFVAAQCLEIGKSLVGPNGQLFQTVIISAATLEGSESHSDDSDVSTGNQASAADDPFADPTATGGSHPGF